jgi:hypothetical protein
MDTKFGYRLLVPLLLALLALLLLVPWSHQVHHHP